MWKKLGDPVIQSPTEIQFLRHAKLRKNAQKKFGAATHTTKLTTGGDMAFFMYEYYKVIKSKGPFCLCNQS